MREEVMDNEARVKGVTKEPGNAGLPQIGYSFKEAQKITGLGRTTLWNAISEGKLKCFKVGRRRLFSISHLEEFLKLYEPPANETPQRSQRKRLKKKVAR
jgi:excisionase family DNA binding protein